MRLSSISTRPLDEAQPLVFLGRVEIPVLHPFAQFTLLGDEVMDASVRGKLAQLAGVLKA